MAKLLTEEEHAALVADRERLEWCVDMGAEWGNADNEELGYLFYDRDQSGYGPIERARTFREAIDKARGGK